MPNPYVNKVVRNNGTTLIDISDTTAVAADVAEGKYFYLATGEKVEGTGGGGGSTRTTIVPEQTANYSERYNQINFIAPLVVGEVYIYTIDGVESQSMAFDNYGSVAIGSPETTIGFEYANGTMYLSIADSSLRGTHTVKVEQEPSGGGGGSATLITKTITANGTYSASDDDADGYSSVTVNVSGGGASNFVTGTFKGTTTGAAMDITLAYTGSGYPVAVIVYPSVGSNNPNGTFYNLVQRYAIRDFFAAKADITTAPDYENTSTTDGGKNVGCVVSNYKASASAATTYSRGGNNRILLYDKNNATSGSNTCVTLKSSTKMSVFIASTSYGFAANIDYTYNVIYSS